MLVNKLNWAVNIVILLLGRHFLKNKNILIKDDSQVT